MKKYVVAMLAVLMSYSAFAAPVINDMGLAVENDPQELEGLIEDTSLEQIKAEAPEKQRSKQELDAAKKRLKDAKLELNALDEWDPFEDPTGEKIDAVYKAVTGENPDLFETLEDGIRSLITKSAGCKRNSCALWIDVSKASQTATVYVNNKQIAKWKVSTGTAGHGTPNFDTNPDGRVYNKYTSRKYPGGDYNGLGNMPYAVFIRGGFAIHGTGRGNWPKLGTPASHGCIRLHPDNAKIFNGLVRQNGVGNTWITVR